MSGWEAWVAYVKGHCEAKYVTKASDETPAKFEISIGCPKTGATWTHSADFPTPLFTTSDAINMIEAANGDRTHPIYGKPPPGYTIMKSVPVGDVPVLTGKSKVVTGRQLFVSQTEKTMLICVVDITNSNKGAETVAMDSFAYAIGLAAEAGI